MIRISFWIRTCVVGMCVFYAKAGRWMMHMPFSLGSYARIIDDTDALLNVSSINVSSMNMYGQYVFSINIQVLCEKHKQIADCSLSQPR